MLLVALTGNIASGKSTVSALLAELGAQVIDADVLARQVVEPGMPALAEIVARWGSEILDPQGALDRQALRRIVFSDPREREALNAIVHPRVGALRNALVEEARARGERVVVCDIPLLYEANLQDGFDAVIFVDAPESVRRARLTTLREIAPDEADAMMHAQLSADEQRRRAHFVLTNDGSLDVLEKQVQALWSVLLERAAQRS